MFKSAHKSKTTGTTATLVLAATLAAALTATLFSSAAYAQSAQSAKSSGSSNGAQSQWWFDIELIVFKRAVDGSQLVEQFDNAITPIDVRNSRDLILEQLFPNTQRLQRSLATCYTHPNDAITLPKQTAPAFEVNYALLQPVIPKPAAIAPSALDTVLVSSDATELDAFEQDATEQDGFEQDSFEQDEAAMETTYKAQLATNNTADHIDQRQNSEGFEQQQLQNIQNAFSMPTPNQTPSVTAEQVARASEPQTTTLSTHPITEKPITEAKAFAEDEIVTFAEDEIVAPAGDEIVAPAGDETVAPAGDETVAQTQLKTQLKTQVTAQRYEPMSLATTWYDAAPSKGDLPSLIQVAVPDNLGCRFAEEFPDSVAVELEAWLSAQIRPLHRIETEATLQIAQAQLDKVINGLTPHEHNTNTSATVADASSVTLAPARHKLAPARHAADYPEALYFDTANTKTQYPEQLPMHYQAVDRSDTQSSYLLPQSALRLRKMARAIDRRRGISNILHMAWRQYVPFGRDKAQSFRIIAGKNYSNEFNYQGVPLSPEAALEADPLSALGLSPTAEALTSAEALPKLTSSDQNTQPQLVQSIRTALLALDLEVDLELAQPSVGGENGTSREVNDSEHPILNVPGVPADLTPEQVWELDGLFNVYLQNIGRVPYLHIDSQFNFRQPIILPNQSAPLSSGAKQAALDLSDSAAPQYFLQPYHFQQLRRVVSRQIHYFDHPMFGMVVQIRRYQIPDFIR